jgi:hypothetical protein
LGVARWSWAIFRGRGYIRLECRAEQSTHMYGTSDRIIRGAYKPNPARNFLGYIGEAQTHSGTVFDTGNPA